MALATVLAVKLPGDDVPFEYGTVPYHQHYARFYRNNKKWMLATPALGVLSATALIDIDLLGKLLVVFYIVLSFWTGARWTVAHGHQQRHEMDAWMKETHDTLNGLLASGLYDSPLEVVAVMRDNPPPPGWSVKEWQRTSDSIAEEMRRQLGS